MDKVIIKRASPKDWKEYKEIRLDALKKDPESFGSSYVEEKDRVGKKWKEKLRDKNRVTLLALSNKKTIGILVIFFESSAKLAHIAHLYSVYLKREHRGKVISVQLMKEAMKIIKAKKIIRKINLHVTINKLPAINLYKKFGFKIVGKLEKEIKANNKYYDSYIMELLL